MQIRPGKARCLGDAKAARTRFDPKVSGSNPRTRWLKKGHVLIVTSLPEGNGLRETLKKHCNLRIRRKKKLNRIFTVGATGIPRKNINI